MLIAARNAMMAGGKLTAKDYVQDGLVAMWDGIENAGWGTHDPNATVWKDLVGNRDLPYSGVVTIKDNCVHGTGANRIAGSSDIPPYTEAILTVEMVMNLDALSYDTRRCTWLFFSASNGSTGRGIKLDYGNNVIPGICPFHAGTSRIVYGNDMLGVKNNFSIVYSSATSFSSAYLNGMIQLSNNQNNGRDMRYGVYLGGNDGYYGIVGDLHCTRLYSRALTADEIAANCAIDKERFNLPSA